MRETRDPAPSPHALGLLSSFILFHSIENSKRSEAEKQEVRNKGLEELLEGGGEVP